MGRQVEFKRYDKVLFQDERILSSDFEISTPVEPNLIQLERSPNMSLISQKESSWNVVSIDSSIAEKKGEKEGERKEKNKNKQTTKSFPLMFYMLIKIFVTWNLIRRNEKVEGI